MMFTLNQACELVENGCQSELILKYHNRLLKQYEPEKVTLFKSF